MRLLLYFLAGSARVYALKVMAGVPEAGRSSIELAMGALIGLGLFAIIRTVRRRGDSGS